MQSKVKKAFTQRIGFKIILLMIFFIPAYSQYPYDPMDTAEVIAAVLANPLIVSIDFLLPMAKLLLLFAVMAVFMGIKKSSYVFLGYYAMILIVVGLFQNMAYTQDYGFTWLLGNTFILFIVSAFCIYDMIKWKTIFKRKNLVVKNLWVILPMLLAFLMPYTVNELGIIQPAFGLFVLTNEAGVTYCMITPVIIGTMILFSKDVYQPTLSMISFIGLVFGMMNMLVWFVFQSQNWWMGILHLPLVILSFYGIFLCRK